MDRGPAGPGDPGGGPSDSRIDAALARMGDLDAAPVDQHPAIYGQVDDRLREALAAQPESGDAPALSGSGLDPSST